VSHFQQFSTEFPGGGREEKSTVPPEIQRHANLFKNRLYLGPFLNAMPQLFLILNPQGQIVFSNHPSPEGMGMKLNDALCHFRPGEVLKCAHAWGNGGCGSREACRLCGAANAIHASRTGGETVRECRIVQHETGEALDLRVWATPYWINDEQFIFLVITDISHEKRRKALERIFFHDILNTAGALLGFCQLLEEADQSQIDRFRVRISRLTEKIIHEIKSQQELLAAENNEIVPRLLSLRSKEFLLEIAEMYKSQDEWNSRDLRIDPEAEDVAFTSDPTLLGRVLGNMIKNALEASTPDQPVTLGCETADGRIAFWVHNPNFMPRDVQLQVFQRSFSTKDPHRGLGTYSMKLLSERYLGGRVTFESLPETGTRFTASYPLRAEE